ncbi:hypothetical protein AJ80_02064 [Polytolypa hystricis UAMH7299]|uniref:Transcriptional regulator n=1 Tax=Polytolypa hystricis (strain UAMH7299) TaxID=1447883 RepID=A0A2B7YQ70_POLH7|nr:hypothetical protein AJ80_02064 [Polytolypa hystricis UAMH7299]
MAASDSSDGELSSMDIPSDDVLEKGLRDVVAKIFKTGNLEELTVKRIRSATEKALGLDEGFFKNDEAWKQRSDKIIKEEAAKQEEPTEAKAQPSPAHKKPKPAPPKTTATKRAATTPSSSRSKKRRTISESEDESESELSALSNESEEEEEEEMKPARAPKRASKPAKKEKIPPPPSVESSSSDLSDLTDEPEEPTAAKKDRAEESGVGAEEAASESEMSVVLDEEPKKRKQKSSSASSQTKPKKPASRKGKGTADIDPDLAEIKRLQGWLIKCGIRKMWARELAPYSTPRAKIQHLKDMLKDAGMVGRYSLEKAKTIREERELKADLEVVQEGAKRWGAADSDDDSDTRRPKRRLARGFQSLGFLDDDGEESD